MKMPDLDAAHIACRAWRIPSQLGIYWMEQLTEQIYGSDTAEAV